MPVLQQNPIDSSGDLSLSSSTTDSPFMFPESSPSGQTMRSISELLGLNMPRGTTLGQTAQNPWSPSAPLAASSPLPLPTLRHQGIRPPSFPPFNKLDVSVNSTDMITQQRAMAQTNSGGFDNAQPIGQMSPLHTPHTVRGSSSYSDCSSPLMEPSLLQNWTSRSISPSDSDVSNVSSADLSDIMNSLNLFQSGGICSPPTEQELANLRALHTLTSSPVLCSMRGSPSVPPSHWSLQLDRQLVFNENTDLLEKVARFHRNRAASFFEAACTWSGMLPRHMSDNPTFSCKVFLGGVPWDVTEDTLVCVFNQFGKVRVEWPGKEEAGNQPKGYVYIIFESEKQVKALLNHCTRDVSSGNGVNWYFRISSRKMKSKEVQVIPWSLSDSNYVQAPSHKLDPHTTVFVGALHGMLNAEGLFIIMNDLFGGVVYAGIDTDKFKYPIGSARVTFNNRHSYMRAVTAAFIEIKTTKFTKKVQVDPYLEDSPCSHCKVQQGPYFCREMTCFRYFCLRCWNLQHHPELHSTHKPLMRSSKNRNTSPPQMRFLQQ
uniref:RRM domain-containing protein n=1 Tax=Homalodisca liturata TaxID=320908 RepID=A0A1B6HY41_9HEMI